MMFTPAMVAAANLGAAFWALDAVDLVAAASIFERAAVVHW